MRVPFKATLVTAICVCILLGLGAWQVQRLHWKNAIIVDLEKSYDAGRNTPLTAEALAAADADPHSFAYGTIAGHFIKDKAVLLGPRVHEGRSGYNLLLPLKIADGTIIVDTGWVSDLWNDTLEERLATLPREVSVRGLVRHPDYSSMASKNSPENNLWFRADPPEIATAKDIPDAHAVLLFADRIDPALQDVVPHEEKFLPRNKHMQYALFWFAMAAVLAAIYGIYVAGINKRAA